jgi:hypothetical protein
MSDALHPPSGVKRLRWIVSLILCAVVLLAVYEYYRNSPVSGAWSDKILSFWGVGFVAFGALSLLLLGGFLYWLWRAEKTHTAARWASRLRDRLGRWRWFLAFLIAALFGVLLLFTPVGEVLSGDFQRLVLLLFSSALIAVCVAGDERRLFSLDGLLLGLVLTAGVHILAERLSSVTAYPFSLTWSEGNRLYDFSMLIDPDRYTFTQAGQISGGRGRNFLWGLPFLLPNTSIWLHRVWDASLWTVPYLVLGYAIARWTSFTRLSKTIFTLWVFVFLFQGPIYTPLILSALVVVFFVRSDRLVVSLVAALIASFYAAASRWTWLVGPAAWSSMILLADFRLKKGEHWLKTVQRLVPIGLVAVAGLVGGLLADARLFSPNELETSTALSQPLLWRRLLPNVNYPEGLLLGLLLATLPVILLLVWLVFSRQWRLNWLQALVFVASGLVFLAGGVVASVKIGGGNNLHNFDLFLVTLVLLVGLALSGSQNLRMDRWPQWAVAMLLLACFLPSWKAVQGGSMLHLPPRETTAEALETIQRRLGNAQKRGEVLLIDQRQLLTFGELQGIQLVPEYEKKLMMDKAMAGDRDYFAQLYTDLANKRFAMILSEPLFTLTRDQDAGFSEENNAWVEWVAKPVLCYYAPVETLSDVRVQLLVPRTNPRNCP